jgi:biopolymer transport protein ExbD
MTDKIYIQEDETRREATAAELTQIKKDEQEAIVRAEIEQAKKDARVSALAKLAALGLTEEEIAAL